MIRPMTTNDVPRVAEIHVFGWRSTARGAVSDDFLFNQLLVANNTDFLVKALESQDTDCFVYDDGIIKGYLMLGECPNSTETLMLKAVYVDPLLQGGGVGTALLNFFDETAKKRGYKNARLLVIEGNATARAFYEKKGYILDGIRNYLKKMDTYDVGYTRQVNHEN